MVTWTSPAAAALLAADTWGIPSEAFLWAYILTGVAAVTYGLLQRARIIRESGGPDRPDHPLYPVETAMLVDDRRPVLVGLAQLREHRLIGPSGGPIGPRAVDERALDQLSRQLYERLYTSDDRKVPALSTAVKGPVDALRIVLSERGYLFGRQERKALYLAAIPVVALLLGGLRVYAGLENNQPIIWLILAMFALLICLRLVTYSPRLTPRGRATLEESRQRYGYLEPRNSPAYGAYGPGTVPLAVALFGAQVLWAVDPELADATNTVATSDGGSGGSSCSTGGSDGGGGGSCGGGCGGGCGG
ncbi:TIGR04222 domain-containing membrane protein [Nocardia crassostreae]|uniref:TIGR04222 domain-containing membrane protein n=1 Tax=Nocardia crassostreae TaxID=53428 RepID=UPI00082DB310|nr:TIGR04222 domain-containing membrane protein [Nocardia crassostreae]